MSDKKTILIAEDEAPMLMALAKKFQDKGFAVIEAIDGQAALDKAMENKPDIILLDIIMPKMEGIEVMRRIREDKKWGSDVPIVMLTNLSDADNVAEASKYGVYDFLVKTDWRLDDIVDIVKQKLFI
ncbi:MAG: Two component, sigma54 specific, transcriptional regulator, Fis family [Candidatus Falkowbacteria bacterium GW2011_GWC2_38_22]|uniref:Two component, sigma54 specific, transcriptional regulator, Fis family n=1 Tax=Candidatus Falkowbacteria bacterium GW2011_GWE1_38_31 TaxID=1618638 RepID=A0A0G0K3H1_9BACT|nr:MAG: Two component, sigma54 specific, transcriptional regulator, Fis family [Candidatus Falkowbacteria bacterium GW2011_GWF2_38_1205]KKQ61201.1 MAG: Two component, sigma54 specific, transcriptional regulator, Fis family [Candidatus Falkowbacteria bacterium GW2011_GWC2_38_22]KKQ63293.1 MAG: Two component, sigma54 specific, transcriptional regulator, Fis family [Candidatus Falkowbacteria bacterium GW2011_GWF1_38_22]KKQ65589.1 MAG: Two component, sigma54 specific, transcriptional regulator, Fis 